MFKGLLWSWVQVFESWAIANFWDRVRNRAGDTTNSMNWKVVVILNRHCSSGINLLTRVDCGYMRQWDASLSLPIWGLSLNCASNVWGYCRLTPWQLNLIDETLDPLAKELPLDHLLLELKGFQIHNWPLQRKNVKTHKVLPSSQG